MGDILRRDMGGEPLSELILFEFLARFGDAFQDGSAGLRIEVTRWL